MNNPLKFHAISHRIFSAIGIILAIAVSSQASADLTYIADDRMVEQAVYVNCDPYVDCYPTLVPFYPDEPFADFSRVGQTSSLGVNGFTASGNGVLNVYISDQLYSYFDISFNLSTATRMQLSGLVTDAGEDGRCNEGVAVYLYDSTGSVLYELSSLAEDWGPSGCYLEKTISYNESLDPGDYRIVAIAKPYDPQGDSTYSLLASFGESSTPDIDGDGFDSISDCNDSDPFTYPGAPETDGDGIDSNCDGLDNEVINLTANLAVGVFATPDPVKKGRKLYYTITVANNGTVAAEQTSIESVFASNVRLINVSSSQGSCADFSPRDSAVNCNLGYLAEGANATINIEAKPMVVGDFVNTINVQTTSLESDLTDNTTSVNTVVYK